MKQLDPSKATQAERLGMGFNSRSGASHSALGDMRTITQETSSKTITASEPRPRDIDIERDLFISLDEFYAALSTPYNSNTNNKSRNEEVIVIAEPEPPKRIVPSNKVNVGKTDNKTMIEGEAQKNLVVPRLLVQISIFKTVKMMILGNVKVICDVLKVLLVFHQLIILAQEILQQHLPLLLCQCVLAVEELMSI